MEMVYQIVAACFAFVVLTHIWRIVNWAYITPKKMETHLRKQGLNGNSYNLIFGDFKEMGKMIQEAISKPINLDDDIKPRVIPFVLKTIQKYGNGSFFWQGTIPSVIITDVGMIKEVMNKYDVYIKPTMPNPLIKLFVPGLITLEREKWAKHRKIINPAFHPEKLKQMVPAFQLSCDEILNEWEKAASPEGYFEVDVCPCLERIASDAISRTAFGSSYQEGRNIFQLQKELAQHVIQVLHSAYIPGYRFLPTKRNQRMKEIEKEVRPRIRALIDKRIGSIKSGRVRNDDLLSTLLESNLNEIKQNGNKSSFGMSMDDIIDECKVLYFVGQETTSVLLTWTLVLLSRHTQWQTRAREEVLAVFGSHTPNSDGLSQLKIVTMILYEVMRLYPSSSTLVRRATEDTKLGELEIPAGVDLEMPTIMLNHNPEIWGDDVLVFNPQRFSGGVTKAQKSSQNSFLPFGWGPRLCVGQNFTLILAKVVLSMILQRFSFELSPSYTHAPYKIFKIEASVWRSFDCAQALEIWIL